MTLKGEVAVVTGAGYVTATTILTDGGVMQSSPGL